jgi:hypothetical protein
VALVVSNRLIAGPQWLSEAWPSGKPCREMKPAALLVEISARRVT